jgi:DNA-binding transcriptional regulator YiaG
MRASLLEQVMAKVAARRALPAPPVLRALREAAGLSEADVARVLGVSSVAVSRYERGQRTPRNARVVQKYVAFLARLRSM